MNLALGEKVRALREELGFTQQQVADRLGITSEFVSMMENGKRAPSLPVLEKLADLFQRDVSYLLAQEKSVFKLLLRADGVGEQERRDLNRFIQLCENYAFIEQLVEAAPPLAPTYPPPSSLQLRTYMGMERYAEHLADAERRRLGLGDEPIRDVFLLLEQQGLHPIRMKLLTQRLAGAFIFSASIGAFTLVNSADIPERQVFTAAHEYCHYLKDRSEGVTLDSPEMVEDPDPNSRAPKELIANIFAANFLMPAASMKRLVLQRSNLGPEDVIYLKQYFGVSYLAMVCRLQSLGWISKTVAKDFKQLRPRELEMRFLKSHIPTGEPAGEELPSRFFQLAVQAHGEGQITLGRLAELLRSTPPEMRRLLASSRLLSIRGEGREEDPS